MYIVIQGIGRNADMYRQMTIYEEGLLSGKGCCKELQYL